ncbi:MAG: hypothetical protein QOE94_2934 [Mycobacterium sp.]|nr:hypothetical protein [Mycobacterium sp.]
MNHVVPINTVESIGAFAPCNSRQPILAAAEAAYAIAAR